jgi:hypothetical protein
MTAPPPIGFPQAPPPFHTPIVTSKFSVTPQWLTWFQNIYSNVAQVNQNVVNTYQINVNTLSISDLESSNSTPYSLTYAGVDIDDPITVGGSFIMTGTVAILTDSLYVNPTAGIFGDITGVDANSGVYGEIINGTPATPSLTTGTPVTVCTALLTPGDWDIEGSCQFQPDGTTVISQQTAGLNMTTNILGSLGTYSAVGATNVAGQGDTFVTPLVRYSFGGGSSKYVYLVAQANFSISTCVATGTIRARRIR